MITNEKMSLNSVEGWAKFAKETNTKSFIHEMGREPRDKAEVTAWVNAAVAQAEALYPTTENKPDPELRTVGGVRYWVTTF